MAFLGKIAQENLTKSFEEHKNLSLIFAVAAMLLAGDLVWFGTMQLGAEYDDASASIATYVRRSDTQVADDLGKQILRVEAELEAATAGEQ